MPLTSPTRRRFGLALTLAIATISFGTGSAGATPGEAAPGNAATAVRGLPQTVTDVLGPADPAFWNPAVPGTRVLTPVDPRDEVICLTGFVPVLNCWTSEREVLASTMRPLAHVDVPMIGGPPLRIWVDLPRWGDGSTGEDPIREQTNDVIVWWLTGRTSS